MPNNLDLYLAHPGLDRKGFEFVSEPADDLLAQVVEPLPENCITHLLTDCGVNQNAPLCRSFMEDINSTQERVTLANNLRLIYARMYGYLNHLFGDDGPSQIEKAHYKTNLKDGFDHCFPGLVERARFIASGLKLKKNNEKILFQLRKQIVDNLAIEQKISNIHMVSDLFKEAHHLGYGVANYSASHFRSAYIYGSTISKRFALYYQINLLACQVTEQLLNSIPEYKGNANVFLKGLENQDYGGGYIVTMLNEIGRFLDDETLKNVTNSQDLSWVSDSHGTASMLEIIYDDMGAPCVYGINQPLLLERINDKLVSDGFMTPEPNTNNLDHWYEQNKLMHYILMKLRLRLAYEQQTARIKANIEAQKIGMSEEDQADLEYYNSGNRAYLRWVSSKIKQFDQDINHYWPDCGEMANVIWRKFVKRALVEFGGSANFKGLGEPTLLALFAWNLDKTHLVMYEQRYRYDIVDSQGNTLVHKAAEYNYGSLIDYFKRQGMSIKAFNKKQETPLHVAMRHAQGDSINALLRSGAVLDMKDSDGLTPMAYESLLKAYSLSDTLISLNKLDDEGQSYLEKRIKQGALFDEIDRLIDQGANTALVNRRNETLFHVACRYRQQDFFRQLFYKIKKELGNAICQILGIHDENGVSVLHLASKQLDFDIVRNLIDNLDASQVSKVGIDVLHNLMARDQTYVENDGPLQIINDKHNLLITGYNVTQLDHNDNTILHLASQNEAIFHAIFQRYHAIKQAIKRIPRLDYLSRSNKLNRLKVLLCVRNAQDSTPLMVAIKNANQAAFETLLGTTRLFSEHNPAQANDLSRLEDLIERHIPEHNRRAYFVKLYQNVTNDIGLLWLDSLITSDKQKDQKKLADLLNKFSELIYSVKSRNSVPFGVNLFKLGKESLITQIMQNFDFNRFKDQVLDWVFSNNQFWSHVAVNGQHDKVVVNFGAALKVFAPLSPDKINALKHKLDAIPGLSSDLRENMKKVADQSSPNQYRLSEFYHDLLNGQYKQAQRLVAAYKLDELKDEDGETVAHYAARLGREKAMEACLKHNPELANVADNQGRTPLHKLDKNQKNRVFNCLIQYGAKVDRADQFGNTPLHEAVRNGFDGLVESMTHYCDVNRLNDNQSPALSLAIRHGNLQSVRKLLEAGAFVTDEIIQGLRCFDKKTTSYDNLRQEPLMSNMTSVMRNVIRSNLFDSQGKTFLINAIEASDLGQALSLLGKTSNTNANKDLIKYKVTEALPNLKDLAGNTPLHVAVQKVASCKDAEQIQTQQAIIQLLIQRGGDYTITDANGNSPVERAVIQAWQSDDWTALNALRNSQPLFARGGRAQLQATIQSVLNEKSTMLNQPSCHVEGGSISTSGSVYSASSSAASGVVDASRYAGLISQSRHSVHRMHTGKRTREQEQYASSDEQCRQGQHSASTCASAGMVSQSGASFYRGQMDDQALEQEELASSDQKRRRTQASSTSDSTSSVSASASSSADANYLTGQSGELRDELHRQMKQDVYVCIPVYQPR